MGIQTALDLKNANMKTLRKQFGVIMERMVYELNGQACLTLEMVPPDKKQIVRSKSFGQPVYELQQLEQAVATYAARAAEKLRQQQGVCQYLSVSIRTNPFKQDQPYYANNKTIGLVYPTDSTILITKLAKRLLKRIYQPGFAYHKAAVCLSEISTKGAMQLDVFAPDPQYSANPKSDALMAVLDKVNEKFGKGALELASQGLKQKEQWAMRRAMCSPRYTTRLAEVLVVN
jgi:DNA polymerase V